MAGHASNWFRDLLAKINFLNEGKQSGRGFVPPRPYKNVKAFMLPLMGLNCACKGVVILAVVSSVTDERARSVVAFSVISHPLAVSMASNSYAELTPHGAMVDLR